jgi:GxxExxY protein
MARGELIEAALSHSAVGAFFEVYNTLGFGFFENLYVTALEYELTDRGHRVAREISMPVFYKGRDLGIQRLDMIVDGRLVIEVKSTVDLHGSAHRQLYSYLKATRIEVGLLFHFGPEAKFYRVVCQDSAARRRPSD